MTEERPVAGATSILFAEAKRDGGQDQIHIWTDSNEVHAIAPEAISAWSELLGYAEPEEALEAILKTAVESSEPPIDPVTGDNVWTDAYALLEMRETAREAEAARANEEGRRDDPRSPKLRATLAAHRAVHEPIDGGECLMDRCRRVARERMNLPEPSRKCGAGSRESNPAPRLVAMARQGGHGSADQQKLQALTAALADQVAPNREHFLHALTLNSTNPLVDGSGSEGVRQPELDSEAHRALYHKYTSGDETVTHPDTDLYEPQDVPLVRLGTHPQEEGGEL